MTQATEELSDRCRLLWCEAHVHKLGHMGVIRLGHSLRLRGSRSFLGCSCCPAGRSRLLWGRSGLALIIAAEELHNLRLFHRGILM